MLLGLAERLLYFSGSFFSWERFPYVSMYSDCIRSYLLALPVTLVFLIFFFFWSKGWWGGQVSPTWGMEP